MSLQKRIITNTGAYAPAGLPRTDMTSVDVDTLWPALKGKGALWVSARMAPAQQMPLVMHCGKGGDVYGGQLSGLARAASTNVSRYPRLGRQTFAFGTIAGSQIEVNYQIPASYIMYAAWAVSGTGNAGMIGVGSATSLRFYSASTSLGFRHSTAANGDLAAAANVRTDGQINVGWACYDAAATTAYLAGMNGAVARLNHYSTELWGVPPPVGNKIHIGSADGIGQVQYLYDAIIVPEPLYVTDNARHDAIVTALAANMGLTAA